MTSLIWNALWTLAIGGLFSGLPLLFSPPVQTLAVARATRGRRRATR